MKIVLLIFLSYGNCDHPNVIKLQFDQQEYDHAKDQYYYWKSYIGPFKDGGCDLLAVTAGYRKIKE